MTEHDLSKTIYEQTCEDFRSLNEIMWKVPLLVMSLTGGLGVAIATFDLSDPTRRALLIFIGSINVAFIIVLFRLRFIMRDLLKRAHEFQGTERKTGFLVVTVLSFILAAGALGSFYYAYNVSDLFQPRTRTQLSCAGGESNITVVDSRDAGRVVLEISCGSLDTSELKNSEGGA